MDDPASDLRVLNAITIDSPCSVPWDEIRGADHAGYCRVCDKTVYDVIAMTTAEAARLLADDRRLPCIRICRGPDGQIVTADSPSGWRGRVWRTLSRHGSWAASLFALAFLPGCAWVNTLANYRFTAGGPASVNKPADIKQPTPGESVRPPVDSEKNEPPIP